MQKFSIWCSLFADFICICPSKSVSLHTNKSNMDTNLERILRDQRDELLTIDYSRFISRSEEKQIELDSHLAQIVIGVRRCGKSTLCQKVLVESKVHFAYVNFDDEEFGYDVLGELFKSVPTKDKTAGER